jgi:hypothetical protein
MSMAARIAVDIAKGGRSGKDSLCCITRPARRRRVPPSGRNRKGIHCIFEAEWNNMLFFNGLLHI